MYEIIYKRKCGTGVVVLVGAPTQERAIELATQSDTEWKKLVKATNQAGQVWFIRAII